MSLIVCNGCGKEIDDRLDICSNCGVALPKSDVTSIAVKKWHQLSKEERQTVGLYRRKNKQFWTISNILLAIFNLLLIPVCILLYFVDSLILYIFVFSALAVEYFLNYLEESNWFKKNRDRLYQDEILK